MTFSVQRLPEPLLLEQVVLDPLYNTFRSYTMVIAIIGSLLFIGMTMYIVGRGGFSTGPAPIPTVVYQESAPTPAPTAPAGLTPEELDRRHSEYLRNRDR